MARASKQQQGVSVVVVTYWTGLVLKENLEALRRQRNVREIIYVDNGNPVSVQNWLDEMAKKYKKIKVVRPARNTGFAAGCNLGVAHASGDFIALVNPDCIVETGTFTKALGIFRKSKDAWLLGANLVGLDGKEQRGSRREILTPWRACVEVLRLDRIAPNHPYFKRFHQFESEPVEGNQPVPTVSGAFMVIRRVAYERVGGMDENLFLHLDDSDICMRMGLLGGQILFCSNLPVIHHLSTSDVSRTFIEWHKARGTNYFFYKHYNGIYPYWFLVFVSLLVWSRFSLLAPFLLIRDLPDMFSRRRRRKAEVW